MAIHEVCVRETDKTDFPLSPVKGWRPVQDVQRQLRQAPQSSGYEEEMESSRREIFDAASTVVT